MRTILFYTRNGFSWQFYSFLSWNCFFSQYIGRISAVLLHFCRCYAIKHRQEDSEHKLRHGQCCQYVQSKHSATYLRYTPVHIKILHLLGWRNRPGHDKSIIKKLAISKCYKMCIRVFPIQILIRLTQLFFYFSVSTADKISHNFATNCLASVLELGRMYVVIHIVYLITTCALLQTSLKDHNKLHDKRNRKFCWR